MSDERERILDEVSPKRRPRWLVNAERDDAKVRALVDEATDRAYAMQDDAPEVSALVARLANALSNYVVSPGGSEVTDERVEEALRVFYSETEDGDLGWDTFRDENKERLRGHMRRALEAVSQPAGRVEGLEGERKPDDDGDYPHPYARY